jgi:predicted outer membrane repeat protein
LGSVRGRVAAGLAGLVVVAGSLVAIGVAPAGATSLVHNEAEFRAAWTDNSETQIDLANDITFTTPCSGSASRNSTTALTVNGNGHTLTLCDNSGGFGVLDQGSSGGLTFQNVTVTGGTAISGGAISTPSAVAVTVTNSTFTHNTATQSGGAIEAINGVVTVTNSTFSANTASAGGGAITTNDAVTVTNSTFSANTAPDNGGGAISAGGLITVAYSTLSGNVALSGSAIGSFASFSPSIELFGSVFVKPAGTGTLCAGPVFGSATSLGHNFANETANSCDLTATGDSSLDANNPLLGALANNGGPTPTQLPQAGSPLVDAIPNAACQTAPLATGITTDQRGLPRPDSASPNCDIGAVEGEGPPAPATTTTTPGLTAAFTG